MKLVNGLMKSSIGRCRKNMTEKTRFRPFILTCLIIFLVIIFHIIFLQLSLDKDVRMVVSDVEAPLVGLGSLIALFLATNRTKQYSKKLARAWFFLALAQLCTVLGDTIWAVLQLGFHINPYPSIADLFYLLYYPLFFVAVVLFPVQKHGSSYWIKRTIDFSAISIGLLAVFWNYLLGPSIITHADVSFQDCFLAYAYPIGDLLILWGMLILTYNRLHERAGGPLVLISIGATVMVITDSAFVVQSIIGTYKAGDILDSGWLLQNILIWIAAVWQIMIARKITETDKISSTLSDAANTLFSYYPVIWLLVVIGMMYQSSTKSLPMSYHQLTLVALLIWVLVVLRQIISNIEIRRLFNQVDQSIRMVKKQSVELETANQVLGFEIAERKKAEERLAFDALHDFLTHLPNRGLFLDRLDMAINHTKRYEKDAFSVLFLDLDQFKQINDTKGHSAGDELLIQVAQRLRDCVRVSDTVARLGGDEFIILLENVDEKENALLTADRILREFRPAFEICGEKIYISVSIGVVISLSGYENSSDILRDADIAMYHAKEAGKSRFEVFNPEMRTQAIHKVMIENELRYAIEYNEFYLQYQPIYSLKTENITGFEALIRWNNPRLGVLSPGVFIPVAEETGLIIEIGYWVLEEACTQLKKWFDLFPELGELTMNVNISGRQFAQPDFIRRLMEILKKSGLKPELLKLEITESVLLGEQQTDSNTFEELKKIGIHLQIDDFGTGYSSLSYIQHIPVDTIKIDRSFIAEVGHGQKYLELIHAIIRMAHSLGMDTNAEGIETLEQKEVLRSFGCNYGQGYLFSKPLDRKQIEKDLLPVQGQIL